jgi:hypothetical protein
MPSHWPRHDISKFLAEVKHFFWDDPYLFKYCPDQIIRRCIPESDQKNVISFCHDHACGGHFNSKKTAAKIFKVDSIGPPFFVMPMPTFQLARDARKWGVLEE